jgi:hypothetical protein
MNCSSRLWRHSKVSSRSRGPPGFAYTPEGEGSRDPCGHREQHTAHTILDQRIFHTLTIRDNTAGSEGRYH